MSGIYTRLHRLFPSTQKTTTNINPIIKIKPRKPIPRKQEPNTKPTPNNFIRDLLREQNPENLIQKFNTLTEKSFFRRQYKLYELTIYRLSVAKQTSLIEQVLETQKKYITSEGFASRIIHLYGKAGMFDHARKVFDELPERKCARGVKSLSALLVAAGHSKRYDDCFELFRELPGKLSIEPDTRCYGAAMNGLWKVGRVDEAVALLDEMEGKGVKPDVVTFSTLMGVFYEKGDLVEGEKMWERMVKSGVVPDMCSYGYKLQGLVAGGKLREAIELVEELKSKKLELVASVFNPLIQGFVKEGNLKGAKKWYRELLKSGCIPNRNTFNILVPFLCERGDYCFAFGVCRKKLQELCSVDEALLQNVVDGLVKKSMIRKAEELVDLGRSNGYCPYNLVMPSMVATHNS